jgi:hypothetical protein
VMKGHFGGQCGHIVGNGSRRIAWSLSWPPSSCVHMDRRQSVRGDVDTWLPGNDLLVQRLPNASRTPPEPTCPPHANGAPPTWTLCLQRDVSTCHRKCPHHGSSGPHEGHRRRDSRHSVHRDSRHIRASAHLAQPPQNCRAGVGPNPTAIARPGEARADAKSTLARVGYNVGRAPWSRFGAPYSTARGGAKRRIRVVWGRRQRSLERTLGQREPTPPRFCAPCSGHRQPTRCLLVGRGRWPRSLARPARRRPASTSSRRTLIRLDRTADAPSDAFGPSLAPSMEPRPPGRGALRTAHRSHRSASAPQAGRDRWSRRPKQRQAIRALPSMQTHARRFRAAVPASARTKSRLRAF